MLFTKNNPPSGFYVYAYLREDGTPYYIGKGKDKRAFRKNKKEKFKPPVDTSLIVILESNLSETDAFSLEKQYIEQYGRKDLGTGILRNMTDGGEGASGAIRTEEFKQHLSKLYSGKPGLSGKLNGMYNKKHSDKVKKESSIRRALTNKARNWYNNGTENKFVKELPGPEWVLGRIQTRRWYNNSVEEIYTTDTLDSTWQQGRLKGNKK